MNEIKGNTSGNSKNLRTKQKFLPDVFTIFLSFIAQADACTSIELAVEV